MTEINCGECGRYRRDDCRPDICKPGGLFKLFLDPMTDPKNYCYLCGQRLKRSHTDKYSPEYREIDLACPVHGKVGKLCEQFVKIQ
jgi:hypothetical protein